MKWKKRFGIVAMTLWLLSLLFCMISYADGNVSGAVEETWKTASTQIRAVVDYVVFLIIDLVLAVFPFGKLGTAYFDFREHGQFGWNESAVLFAYLVFTLTASTYIWQILGT